MKNIEKSVIQLQSENPENPFQDPNEPMIPEPFPVPPEPIPKFPPNVVF